MARKTPHFKPTTLTDKQIIGFRWQLQNSEFKLKQDCLVATGFRRSPHPGGKGEARQRVADAMNARLLTVAKLGKAIAAVVTVSRGNLGSIGAACVCGHAVEEHGHDAYHPGSTACSECPDGDCVAYESDSDGSAPGGA